MNVFIDINGVCRDFIQKLEYIYTNTFEFEDENIYGINRPILNDDLSKYFKFSDKIEMDNFIFIENVLELFGYAKMSDKNTSTDLNRLMFDYPDFTFYFISRDEIGKSIPATLFFLSKNGFIVKNFKVIETKDIKKEWRKCDIWVTDSAEVINKAPKNKMAILFKTNYNQQITHKNEVKNIKELCQTIYEKIFI